MYLLRYNRNFLFLFLGRLVTNIGDSLYYVAAMWLVYDLSGSAFYSGVAGFLTLLPMALQFLTGPFVDRWNITIILVLTQLSQCIIILIIPFAYHFNFLTAELVLIILPIVSLIEQFAYPAQTKALPVILEKTELIKGNSLFSFAYQGIDLVFNSISGILVAMIGAVSLFLVDSLTFAVATLLFAMVKLPQQTKSKQKTTLKTSIKTYGSDLKEGFSIVFSSLLGTFLLGSIFANAAIGASQAVLPAFSDLTGGAYLYGFYLAAMSTGALVGALISPWFGRFPIGRLTIICFTVGGSFWIIGPVLPSTVIGVIFFGLAWIPVGATNVLFATVSQIVIPHQFLGRVNAVSRSMSVVAMPIGSLIGGSLASFISPLLIFSITGCGILFVAFIWLLHPKLRNLPTSNKMNAQTFQLHFEEQKEKT